MKGNIPLILILASALIMISCKKSQVQKAATPAIKADWQLVSDTVVSVIRVSLAYQGLPGDYYNFASNGKLYVNEGKYGRDTAEYTVIADTAVTLTKVYNGVAGKWGGYTNPWQITVLTNHKMVLTSGAAIPGAGWQQKIITLSR